MTTLTRLETSPSVRQHVHRRTVLLMMTSETLGSVAAAVGFTVVGILAAQTAGSTSAVGLTQASQTVGTAIASYALAAWMEKRGRRPGLTVGYLVGSLGAALCVAAAATDRFLVLLAGSVAVGWAGAASSLSRYAATDLAPAGRQARSLSLVVWAGTAGAVAGPLLVPLAEEWTPRLAGLPPLAGPFLLASVSAALAAVLIAVLLRPDPLLLARAMVPGSCAVTAVAAQSGNADAGFHHRTPWRPVVPTIAALALAHTTMVAVMVMTPIHMHQAGATHGAIGGALSAHLLGMYVLAPASGILADRVGVRVALRAGGLVLLVSVAILAGIAGDSSAHHAAGMFVLGLGWSISTVAASAHIAAYSAGDTRIQGIGETAMAVASAATAAASGLIMAAWDFQGLLILAAVLSFLVCMIRLRSPLA